MGPTPALSLWCAEFLTSCVVRNTEITNPYLVVQHERSFSSFSTHRPQWFALLNSPTNTEHAACLFLFLMSKGNHWYLPSCYPWSSPAWQTKLQYGHATTKATISMQDLIGPSDAHFNRLLSPSNENYNLIPVRPYVSGLIPNVFPTDFRKFYPPLSCEGTTLQWLDFFYAALNCNEIPMHFELFQIMNGNPVRSLGLRSKKKNKIK